MKSFILPALLIAILVSLYSLSLAPDITWANHGADGGDLITAAVSKGVAHPTGYPTYLFLLSLFHRILPFGSYAFRSNLFSMVMGILTTIFLYVIIHKTLTDKFKYHIAFFAALWFGCSPLFWSQAVITEVYTLHTAFIAGILLLLQLPQKKSGLKAHMGMGFLLGTGLGNHITLVFLIPFILFTYIKEGSIKRKQYKPILAFLTGTAFGASIYCILIFRSLQNPYVNWGQPDNLQNLWWLISGKLYQYYLFSSTAFISSAFNTLQNLFAQFGIVGSILILTGLLMIKKKNRTLSISTIGISVCFLVFSILYSTVDAYIHLIPVTMMGTVWIAWGLEHILGEINERSIRWVPAVLFCALALRQGIVIFYEFPNVNAHNDHRAVLFGNATMKAAPQHAILLMDDDEEIFTLWYYQQVLNLRPDIAIVAEGLMRQGWYIEMLSNNYPNHQFAKNENLDTIHLLTSLNPDSPICWVDHRFENQVSCYE